MKNGLIALLLVLCTLVTLVSCGAETPTDEPASPAIPESVMPPTEPDVPRDLVPFTKEVYEFWLDTEDHTGTLVFRSPEELTEFCTQNASSIAYSGFEEGCQKYDATFFADNNLLSVYTYISSISIGTKLTQIEGIAQGYAVHILHSYPREGDAMTDECTYVCYLVTLDKDEAINEENTTVQVTQEHSD